MTWTINGVDPRSTYGLVISEVAGWQDAVTEAFPATAVPGRAGLLRISNARAVSPRKLVAQGHIFGDGANLAARAADARTKLDGLRALLAKDSLTIIMADTPSRSITADSEQIVVRPPAASIITDKLPLTISLTARDPYSYSTATTTLAGISGIAPGTAAPLGTASARPVITATFTAGAASYTATLYNSAGVAIGSITLTHAFIATDVLVIDCAARTITFNGVLRPDFITAGDFFELDARSQGDYATSAWPSIKRGANANTDVTYRKAWR